MEIQGLIIGFFSFSISIVLAFNLLKENGLNQFMIWRWVALCAVGHFLGAILFYFFALKNGGDSRFYFNYATTQFNGLSYHFVLFLFGYLRLWFFGDSFLGAFLFSSALGFLGSLFYLLTFKVLLDKISAGQHYYLLDSKILFFPAIILLCWPSYFFWSAGLGKDSISFLAIGMFLFVTARQRLTIANGIIFGISSLLGFLVRPYLFIIFVSSIFLYIIFMGKLKPLTKMLMILLLIFISLKMLAIIAVAAGVSDYSLNEVSKHAIMNQSMTSTIGVSSIPVPTHNHYLLYLFLPYLMAANLFLPLFYGARNMLGLISSFENIYFLYLVCIFVKNRKEWKMLKSQFPILNFFIIYFIFGMAFLGLINTNLGVAMREKMMYVPSLLIIISVMYAYRRIQVIERAIAKYELSSQNNSNLARSEPCVE